MIEQGTSRQTTDIKVNGGGIAERLAALKKSGEEDWKKKIPRLKKDDQAIEDLVNNKLAKTEKETAENDKNSTKNMTECHDEVPTLRKKMSRIGTPLDGARPVSLVERLSQLESAQSSWQARVGEKDAEKFTVASKMQKLRPNERPVSVVCPSYGMSTPSAKLKTSTSVQESCKTPVADPVESSRERDREKKTPKPRRFHGSPPPKAESGSFDESQDDGPLSPLSPTHPNLNIHEDVEKFFSHGVSKPSEKVDCSEADFDLIVPDTDGGAIVHFRKAGPKPQNRRQRGSRNPVKQLTTRTDLKIVEQLEQMDYFEDPKEEMRKSPTKSSRDSVHAHLAAEALAGLASKEDFSNVQLKKNNTCIPHQDMAPYKPGCMLLQVKGRRICQTRLVEPSKESVNSGDAYILVTPKEIFNWVGEFSNVIERSRSADVALTIYQKRDLGCKTARRVTTIEEEKVSSGHVFNKSFWSFLGCPEPPSKVKPPGPSEEDEDYEVSINDLNLVWNVDAKTCELVPEESYWGAPPKYEVLEDMSRVLVFDFGSEVYVWNGRNAPFETRRLGVKLAKDLWEKGLEGTSPVDGHPLIPNGIKRPDWALLGKVNQNMETILFREKFLNWPDKTRLIQPSKESAKVAKKVLSSPTDSNVKLSTDVERNFDISEMVQLEMEEPNLELEMTFLGRGRSYYDLSERRQYEIETLLTTVWHVTENATVEVNNNEWNAQFYFEDSYVVRWKYKVSLTGRDLKGNPSKHIAVGRERWAYFFWQGCESGVNEKGAAALMTVELDKERGPHIRVVQGKEPAAFLNMWSGNMVVHLGRRGGPKSADKPRLFVIRGETPEEAHCVEVNCTPSNFRSRGCFLYVVKSTVYLWIGHGSPAHTRKLAQQSAEKFSSSNNKTLIKEHEGDETGVLKEFLADGQRRDYVSMIPALAEQKPSLSTRLFMMSSVSGEFLVNEVQCPFLNHDVPNLMPFSQSDLYSAEQPALFLIDAGGECLWLWQGWWPDVGHDSKDTNLSTGSGMIRWHAERRVAMQTTKEYRDLKYKTQRPKMNLVWAGHEPLEFTNLFPTWTKKEDIQNLNLKYLGDSSLDTVLSELSRSTYSWEELKKRPLPDGVDPAKLENYLSDEEFEKYLGMKREEFSSAPRWKRLEIRKEKGLF